jgi:hypothetical protein
MAVVAFAPSTAAAVPSVQRFDTTLSVRGVTVEPDQTLSVNGTVDSKWYCEQQRDVRLWMVLDGPDQVVDIGFSSLFGTAWALRSFGGDADGANQFYVKAKRLKLKLRRQDGSVDHAICRPARAAITYTASP